MHALYVQNTADIKKPLGCKFFTHMRMKSWTMNCGLLLLLVAALYTTGCVNAETITVADAKRAITAAWKLYGGANTLQKSYTATVKLNNGQDVAVKCYFGAHGGERLDCGLPPHQYLLPESKADQIGNWFLTKIAADGKYRKVMGEKGLWSMCQPLALCNWQRIQLSS